jgi:hypothetical protein
VKLNKCTVDLLAAGLVNLALIGHVDEKFAMAQTQGFDSSA